MTTLRTLNESATAAPWAEGDVRFPTRKDEPCIYAGDGNWIVVARKLEAADRALIVRLRNDYSSGALVEREKVEALVATCEDVAATVTALIADLALAAMKLPDPAYERIASLSTAAEFALVEQDAALANLSIPERGEGSL